MNSNIEKGKKEYDAHNYKKALEYFNKVSENDENYPVMVIYKINSLMKLEEYEKCLLLLNSLIEKSPYDELFWYEKIRCHILLKQNNEAFKALSEFERLIDKEDKYFTLSVSKFYGFLEDYENALKFCNRAIALDEDYEDAYLEKAQIASALENNDLMMETGEKLISLADGDMVKLMMPFILNMFCCNYRRCYEIIDLMEAIDEEHILMLKSTIYEMMIKDLDIEIKTSAPCVWTVDDALNLLFKYKYEGIRGGIYQDVNYVIV